MGCLLNALDAAHFRSKVPDDDILASTNHLLVDADR